MTEFHATTICAVKRNGMTAIAGDGQVTMGAVEVEIAELFAETQNGSPFVLYGIRSRTRGFETLTVKRVENHFRIFRFSVLCKFRGEYKRIYGTCRRTRISCEVSADVFEFTVYFSAVFIAYRYVVSARKIFGIFAFEF